MGGRSLLALVEKRISKTEVACLGEETVLEDGLFSLEEKSLLAKRESRRCLPALMQEGVERKLQRAFGAGKSAKREARHKSFAPEAYRNAKGRFGMARGKGANRSVMIHTETDDDLRFL